MPRKRGHGQRGKKSGTGSTAAQSASGSHVHDVHHPVQNVQNSTAIPLAHTHDLNEREKAFQYLEEMFRESVDADVIHMVLVECDWKVEDALESLITLSGVESNHVQKECSTPTSTLSGIASSLFANPTQLGSPQNDLGAPAYPTPETAQRGDFNESFEEEDNDDCDLTACDEIMVDQISESVGVANENITVPSGALDYNLDEIDDAPSSQILLQPTQTLSAMKSGDPPVPPELTSPPDLTRNIQSILPDLTNHSDITAHTSSCKSSSSKTSADSEGFAESMRLADTYEKLAQSSNYYLYDFEEIRSTEAHLTDHANTVSHPSPGDELDIRPGMSPVLELYQSGSFDDASISRRADLEKTLGDAFPKPLEFGAVELGACSHENNESNGISCKISPSAAAGADEPKVSSAAATLPTLVDAVGPVHSLNSESDIMTSNCNAPLSLKEIATIALPVEATGPLLESSVRSSHFTAHRPADLDASASENEAINCLDNDSHSRAPVDSQGILKSVVGQDIESNTAHDKDVRNGSDMDVDLQTDTGYDYADVIAAAEANSDDEEKDDSETERKLVHIYAYSSTGSSKEESPEPVGSLVEKKVYRKKKKRSDGTRGALHCGSEEDLSCRDAGGLVSRMVGARNFLKQNPLPFCGDHVENNFKHSTGVAEVDFLSRRPLDNSGVLKTEMPESTEACDFDVGDCSQSDSDMIKTFGIDELTELKTSQSDSESSDSSHKKIWPDILDTLPKPIATISADIASRIPELEIMEYNLETIEESAELGECAEESYPQRGSIRRFITLDDIELPPKVARTADLVANLDDIPGGADTTVKAEDDSCIQDAVFDEACTMLDDVDVEGSGVATSSSLIAKDEDCLNHVEGFDISEEAKAHDEASCGNEYLMNKEETSTAKVGDAESSVEGEESTSNISLENTNIQAVAEAAQIDKECNTQDPGTVIKMMLGIESASSDKDSSKVSDSSSVPPAAQDIQDLAADSAIKRLLGIGTGDVDKTEVKDSDALQGRETFPPPEKSIACEPNILEDTDAVKSQSKLSVDAQEFVPMALPPSLPSMPVHGAIPSSQNDLPFMMPTYITPKMSPDSSASMFPMSYPPISHPFYPVPMMPSHPLPFHVQPGFQPGVFFHSSDTGNLVAPTSRGRGWGKGKRGGRKSPFSKLAANFNQVNMDDHAMSLPSGFKYGAGSVETAPDLNRYKRQRSQPLDVEFMGRESSRDCAGLSEKVQRGHQDDVRTFHDYNDRTASHSGETSHSSDTGQPLSFAAMVAKSSQESSSHQSLRNSPKRKPQSPSKNHPVQVVKHHLDNGDKVLILMRGCPGSGKSTLARQLLFNGIILSTDDFFITSDGWYLFEQEKIGEAHEWNHQRAVQKMEEGVNPIIIDNTNSKMWEMKPYVVTGLQHGYAVEIFEPNTPWQFRAGECARRNSHGVNRDSILRMIDRYDRNVTLEQIVGSSDKLRKLAVKRQAKKNANVKEENKTKKDSGEKKKPPVKQAACWTEVNRFAVLESESEASSAGEEEIFETPNATLQAESALAGDVEGSAGGKTETMEDVCESESSKSASREISPDVIVESDGEDSLRVCAEFHDGIQDISMDSSEEFKSAESDVNIDDVMVRDDVPSSGTGVIEVQPRGQDKMGIDEPVLCPAAQEKEPEVESPSLGEKARHSEHEVLETEASHLLGKSPKISWAGWGSSPAKGASSKVSMNQKSSEEWRVSGETQPYFWSEAPGAGVSMATAPAQKKSPEISPKKNPGNFDERKPDAVEARCNSTWEEPKERRQRRARSRHNTPTPTGQVHDGNGQTDSSDSNSPLKSAAEREEAGSAVADACLNLKSSAEETSVEAAEGVISVEPQPVLEQLAHVALNENDLKDVQVPGKQSESEVAPTLCDTPELEILAQVTKLEKETPLDQHEELTETSTGDVTQEEGPEVSVPTSESPKEEAGAILNATIEVDNSGTVGSDREIETDAQSDVDSSVTALSNGDTGCVEAVESSVKIVITDAMSDVKSDVELAECDTELKVVAKTGDDTEVASNQETDGPVSEIALIDFDGAVKTSDVATETSFSAVGSEVKMLEDGTSQGAAVASSDSDGIGNEVMSLQKLSKAALRSSTRTPDDDLSSTPQDESLMKTPPRKTKSNRSKLSPKQKFVEGIKQDIAAIRQSLPQDWSLLDSPVAPRPAGVEMNSSSEETKDVPEVVETGTWTCAHDFVLLYKVQKSLPCDLSDYKVVEYSGNFDIQSNDSSFAESDSAPGSPRKRRLMLDKSCSTDELLPPSSLEADITFLQSCFPTVSSQDLKEILNCCGKDVEWAVNLLLDSGYEYNSPNTTKEREKSLGRDDDKDVDTAQDSIAEVAAEVLMEKIDSLKDQGAMGTKASVDKSATPGAQLCHQPGGLVTLSQNALTHSNWYNSWGSLGGYDLPMPGDYLYDVADLPFEQTTLPPQVRSYKMGEDLDSGSDLSASPHHPQVVSDLDQIDNVEIKTTQQNGTANFFGLVSTAAEIKTLISDIDISSTHEKLNAEPPAQTSTPKLEGNKYQKIIDTVTGATKAPIIEPVVYMAKPPGIRKLKGAYDYSDPGKEEAAAPSESTDSAKAGDATTSDDINGNDVKDDWGDEDCGLSLELSAKMALGLQELFGPVGFKVDAESLCPDDLKISLNFNIARLLHEAWAKTLEEKFLKEEDDIMKMLTSDAALAQQLQDEEDAMHHMTKVFKMPKKLPSTPGHSSPLTGHSPKSGRSPSSRRKYKDAPSSGITFREEFPVLQQQPDPSALSLQQIMAEEMAAKKKKEEEAKKLGSSASKVTMATRMKQQKLYELFPGIQESVLDDIFESCGYALEPTVSAIRGSTEESAQSVFTSRNLTDYEEILVREAEVESMKKEYLGRGDDASDYQEYEDPDYQDFRAEAALHYRLRHECFQKAQEANGRGMKQVATFYSQQGHMHSEKIKAANKRASERILQSRGSRLLQSNTLDLHGLHVSEAIEALEDTLIQRQNENRERPDKKKVHLYVVTGRGAHSRGGIARIKPAVVSYLTRNRYRYSEPQAGMLRINVNQFAQ